MQPSQFGLPLLCLSALLCRCVCALVQEPRAGARRQVDAYTCMSACPDRPDKRVRDWLAPVGLS